MNRRSGEQWIAAAAGIEAVTGLVLIIRPSLAAWLLFGAELSDLGQAVGRFAGIALVSLALACWPRGGSEGKSALLALLVFGLLTTVYLAYLGIAGAFGGVLLWPAVALHAVLALLLGHRWFSRGRV